jgi:streptomycin 6-kinase
MRLPFCKNGDIIMTELFDKYLTCWHLTPDGEPITTPSSQLLPVRYRDQAAILKIATCEEERLGGHLMVWWDGEGAAPVLEYDDKALLLIRAMGMRSLTKMAGHGYDDEASRIICQVIIKLHEPKPNPPATLVPLSHWFRALAPAALQYGGILEIAAQTAKDLLSEQQNTSVLHGDIHHGNILNFESLGWLAIDPKGLIGEHYFDFANLFCNPNYRVATQPKRLTRQIAIVAETANLDRKRLLHWILAYAGLSAAWSLEEHTAPDLALAIAAIVAVEIRR